MSVTRLISAPSQQPKLPNGEGYGVLIGGEWYRLAVTPDQPVRYYTRDSLAQRRDDSGNIYENTLDIGFVFARGDLSGGEGLDWFPRFISQLDDQEQRDKIRFWDSQNIDVRRPVRGELSRITLSKQDELWRDDETYIDLATSDVHLFSAHGSVVRRWTSWESLSPATESTASGPIKSIVSSPAGDLMALLEDGTLEYLPAGSNTFAPVPGASAIEQHWFAKGRFIASRLQNPATGLYALYEVDAEGYIGAGPFWEGRSTPLSCVSSGPAVVVAMSDGTLRSYVPEQSNQLDPDSMSLVIRGITELPEGEIPFLLGSNADILLVLTRTSGLEEDNTLRVYQAEVLDARFDYIIGQLQLRREWLNTAAAYDIRKNTANTRDEIWFIVEENDDEQSLWRFDLVTFGLSRHATYTPRTTGRAFVIFDNRGGYITNSAIYRESAIFFDEGWLITPNITFGLNTDINWIAVVVAATNLAAAGRQVELLFSTDSTAILDKDHPSWRLAARLSSSAQSNADQLLTNVTGLQAALQIRLLSSENGTAAPNVNNFAIRGIQARRDWILELPLNVSDSVEVPGRRAVQVPGLGDLLHNKVLNLLGKSVEILVSAPPILWRGVIDNIAEPTVYIGDRGSSSVRAVVQCRGERVVGSGLGIGDEGIGLGLLGVATLGIGEALET